MSISEGRVYDITKEYNSMFKVIIYKNGFDPNALSRQDKKENKRRINTEDSIQRSVRRSRSVINDYVHCNDFDLFVTFTFDPKKVDRYDLNSTYIKMQGWLWRQHRKYKDFQYIIVPERHKDGAIHFHALISGYEGNLLKTKVIQNNRRVYNIPSYRFGFTNAQYLDEDVKKTTAYLCKYITKDMELIHSRRRYWCSKNLKKPVSVYNKIYDMGLNKFLNHKTVIYETEYNVIHEVPKDLFA